MTDSVNRRSFLKSSGAIAAGTSAFVGLSAKDAPAQSPNQNIRIGFIGPGGRGFGAHVRTLAKLKNEGANIELVSVAEVFSVQREKVADYIKEKNGNTPTQYVDYREMLEKENLDAVSIATPDHWHHKQVLDSLAAGLHVYCEKPMTKNVEEALDVVEKWEDSGKVMQVGVQGTSQPVWNHARELLNDGKLGKVMMFQTEYFRNSAQGQWRYYELKKDMTPQNIDWQRWLGVEEGLAEDRPFDREVYKQWRRFWPFGSGMYTDLFVHRVTMMLKATGLRYPGRVVGAGGLYLEYDGRGVPDVATVAADYPEGVHGLVSSTMCSQESRIDQCIRGHFGSFIFNGDKIQYIPERPQVTRDSSLAEETIQTEPIDDQTYEHFKNWIAAMNSGNPLDCNNPPDLGAAAVTTVILGAQSYRNGVCYYFDPKTGPVNAFEAHQGGKSWADQWEKISKERGKPKHIPGWTAGDYGSTLEEPAYMKLAGPWKDGQPPA
ncbi:Inositol 2-dehydrogenase [Thalassoglobus neptunius]|uniref:Inositol 2-dehydrogenase n=1 Tax=Thalassoglobus neptunius TaxID=1938619 RepID=A0A5C5WXV0_9PLAN|nr:Gfo/Idh/MocA family oxidoreductase [Thalassoglobus neptunius]TWT55428.1 Inositol 2-dehydrogenase [Thalassoglobus neptunius]